MPTSVQKPNSSKATVPGKIPGFSTTAIDARQKEKRARKILLNSAVQYCKDGPMRAKKAISTGLFPGPTVSQLLTALKKSGSVQMRDHPLQILLNDERKKLASWILECSDGGKDFSRSAISKKIVMMKGRHADNRRKGFRLCQLLNEAERGVLT